jgi:hypothetical protein
MSPSDLTSAASGTAKKSRPVVRGTDVADASGDGSVASPELTSRDVTSMATPPRNHERSTFDGDVSTSLPPR